MRKLSEIPDRITPLFLTAPMLFVHKLSITALLLQESLVGLVIVGKTQVK